MRMWPIVGLTLALLTHGAPVSAQSTGTQGFNVVLVLGDLQDGGTSDTIPAAARMALGDLRDFLPYRSYRMLDTAWILGTTTQLFRATSRLRGDDDQNYDVNLTSSPVGGTAPALQMQFVMIDGAQRLIDTSFNMRHGETVVVGTSRVRGEKALIVLLTAVRK